MHIKFIKIKKVFSYLNTLTYLYIDYLKQKKKIIKQRNTFFFFFLKFLLVLLMIKFL